jgi:hypothetical protein
MPLPDKVLREMKIISDQKGIIDRYISEAGGWDEHLARTREFILESVNAARPDSILICGSGWLLDVPLEELAEICPEIYLADIYHPQQIRNKIRKIPGCRLLQADLTGGAVMAAYAYIDDYRKTGTRNPVSSIPVSVPLLPVKPGYIISVNMLNQMDILLVDYLKRYIKPGEEELAAFRKSIQQNHLSHLATCPSCIITDAEEIIINSQGQETDRKNLLYTRLPEGSCKSSWIWKFDSSGSYNQGMTTHFLVKAVAN